jgi:hypothetical protein
MGENLQAKFEAVSTKKEEEIKFQSNSLANDLGLNTEADDGDVTMNASNSGSNAN